MNIEDKKKLAISNIESLVSNYMYYDRKEDIDLSVEDMEEILDMDLVNELTSKFKSELIDCIKN
jgi:hypothetical protein